MQTTPRRNSRRSFVSPGAAKPATIEMAGDEALELGQELGVAQHVKRRVLIGIPMLTSAAHLKLWISLCGVDVQGADNLPRRC